MHFTCAVITSGDRLFNIDQVDQLMAPHREDEDSDGELLGWWDWYEIGGRWPRELVTKDNGLIAPLSRSWKDPLGGDESYINRMKALWRPNWVDSCPVSSIDWDGMGMKEIDQLRARYQLHHERPGPFGNPEHYAMPEDEYVRQNMKPWSVYRVLRADGTTSHRPEPWDLFGNPKDPYDNSWHDYRDDPVRLTEYEIAHDEWRKNELHGSITRAEPGSWLTVVDYHS